DRSEGRLLLLHLAQTPEHLRHTTMIGLGRQRTSQLLDQSLLAGRRPRAALRGFADEAIAEGRWTETLADIVHESNNCVGDCRGIARTSLDGSNQSVESVPCVSFPNRQAAHEHGPDCPCGVVVSREDEQR